MALQNYQYDMILREYSRRQAEDRRNLQARREEVSGKIPRLGEIREEIASLSAEKARALLRGSGEGAEDLKSAIDALAAERQALLSMHGYPADYLEPSYFCPLCQDTGYIGQDKCACFRRTEIELLYTQPHLREILEKENFDHFSFAFYSDTIINEATGLSALETARRAYDTARDFVTDFDTRFQNLFFYGNTGVGKTFLSHCIAKELLESSHSVLYFSAFDLFDHMAENVFTHRGDAPQNNDLIFDCDLLIIDDLGTELTNSFVSSQLFLCVNERLLRQKATVISTNLELANFSETYSERTFSRIAGHYQMVKMIGKDIRIQKIFLGGK